MSAEELPFPSDGPQEQVRAYEYISETMSGPWLGAIHPQAPQPDTYDDYLQSSSHAQPLNGAEYAYWLAIVAGMHTLQNTVGRSPADMRVSPYWEDQLVRRAKRDGDSVLSCYGIYPEPPEFPGSQQ